MSDPSPPVTERDSIFGRHYAWVSIGMSALITLTAFESLAVTTIMPLVSAELHGRSLYALAFTAPIAIGVVGMVAAGNWSDRRGPRGALWASVLLFVVGLIVVGTAANMWILVIGRLVQGLGTGAMTVALYVIVARIYPPGLHAKIFAAFAAAWVVPSLIGPFIAGSVADAFGWRWVFLGVIALVVAAMAMVIPAMRRVRPPEASEAKVPWQFGRMAWSLLTAVAVLIVDLASQSSGVMLWLVPLIALGVALVALHFLLPVGTLRALAGLPSVLVVRALAAGAFFGAEVYVPYLLTQQYGFAAWAAGLALTAAGLSWAALSWLQGRLGSRLSNARALGSGSALLAIAIAVVALTAAFSLSPAVLIVAWTVAGAGMGLMYPRTSVATLEFSTIHDQGFNTSGLSIADSFGASLAIALTAIVFASLAGAGGVWPFAATFALGTILAIAAVVVSPRVGVSPRVP